MKCDLCGKGKVSVKKVKTSQEIKGTKVYFEAEALVCSKCGGHYWNTELGDKMAKIASNTYRKEHGLLTSDEIVKYRTRLGMSQAQFSKFVPIAIASLKRYESFGIQDESMNKLIKITCDEAEADEAKMELKSKIEHVEFGLSAKKY